MDEDGNVKAPLVTTLLLFAIAAHLVGYVVAAWWLFWSAVWLVVLILVIVVVAVITKLVSG